MTYKVELSDDVLKQLKEFRKSGNKFIVAKIKRLLIELQNHPKTGTGKPEQLKYELQGLWSRRINKEHRLIYKIEEEKLVVITISVKGHYT